MPRTEGDTDDSRKECPHRRKIRWG